jgi:tetratricopeptide (TPR) repeat protein
LYQGRIGVKIVGSSDSKPATQAWTGSRLGVAVAAALIAIAVLGAYANSLSGEFVLDDHLAIESNASIRHLGAAWFPPANGPTGGRPLLNLSFALNRALGGTNVQGYHAVNILIHLLAALTLFGLVRRTLPQPGLESRFGADATWLAAAIAAVWALHPLSTEVVSYVSQRSESMAGLFYLLTIYGLVRGAASPAPSGWKILSVSACLLGILSKETIATAPVMAFLYDRTFLAGSFREAWRRRRGFYLALAATWLPLAFLMSSLGQRGIKLGRSGVAWRYALTSCRSVFLYLKLSLWPHPLVFDYGQALARSPAEVWPEAAVLALLLAAAALALIRYPKLGFAGAWFFIVLAPASSVIPIPEQPTAENRAYLALAAVVSLGALGLYARFGRRGFALIAAWALLLGCLTAGRNRDYRTELRLLADTIMKRPDCARAHCNLGRALCARPGLMPQAIEEFQAALQIDPDYSEAHVNLGSAWATRGKFGPAMAEYRAALRSKPNNADAHNDLGSVLLMTGRPQAAIAEYSEALRIKPDFAEAHRNMAHALEAIPGRKAEAVAQLCVALETDPGLPSARQELARLGAAP